MTGRVFRSEITHMQQTIRLEFVSPPVGADLPRLSGVSQAPSNLRFGRIVKP
jgi:hypothetical protein